jgi:ABC-type cobalt transport system substrate-binding protein
MKGTYIYIFPPHNCHCPEERYLSTTWLPPSGEIYTVYLFTVMRGIHLSFKQLPLSGEECEEYTSSDHTVSTIMRGLYPSYHTDTTARKRSYRHMQVM